MTAATESGPANATVADRLRHVRDRVAGAARRADRSPHEVTVVAVAKTFGTDLITAAREAGQVDIGESKAQELTSKWSELGSWVRWHFVGQLQRNKVKDVVGVATLVHSVDRLALAEDIAERAARLGTVQRVLVQVNVTGDDAKAGCEPDAVPGLVRRLRDLPHLACEGLATIPAADVDPRPAFASLRALRDDAAARFPEVSHLSMGMSGDYEVAVEEGATLVRVGEAVFGPRAGG